MTRTLCFVSARNLGDAVIHADFLRALSAAGYADQYIVWTSPQAAFLFQDLENCRIFESSFPMGATVRRFFPAGLLSFWRAVRAIRCQHPTETLELVSDVRERIACKLLGASRDLFIGWYPNHVFRKHSRMGPFRPSPLINIPAAVQGLYAAYNLVFEALIGPGRQAFAPLDRGIKASGGRLRIGIHPFASVPCKLWPQDRWASLIRALQQKYPLARFILFGAPSDRVGLENLQGQAVREAEVFTASLGEFKLKLCDLDLLIGLDSFSIHLAHSQGIPAVVLIGPNDPNLFTPPGAKAVSKRSDCPHQPCGGKPRCIGRSFQYACMTSISPRQVLDAVAELAPA